MLWNWNGSFQPRKPVKPICFAYVGQTDLFAHVAKQRAVASLLKRWLLGTHQGAIGHAHLDYYLDEFTFRFNRRSSKSRGKLFYRLLQQAVQVDPVTYNQIIGGKQGFDEVNNEKTVETPKENYPF